MHKAIDDAALDTVFRNARTHNKWQDKPVSPAILMAIYELMALAPTAGNSSPARMVFVASKEAKERLKPHLAAGNVEKTMAAPVTAILAYDLGFARHMDRLFPQAPALKQVYSKPEIAQLNAFRNGSLQGGYFILAARALGLDCGPMSGFDNAGVDGEFFAGTEIKSNFLCNLGYGDPAGLYPRNPRLSFDEVCQIV